MKCRQRIITTLLLIAFLFILLPNSSFAVTNKYRIEELQLNHWYSLEEYSSAMTIYKFQVPEDSALIVTWKNLDPNAWVHGEICTDLECMNDVATFLGYAETSTGTDGAILYPGTYYIQMYDSREQTKVKLTKKTVKAINKQNYCVSKAVNLKKNKKAEIAQTRSELYTRWYKIVLTQEQVISIYGYDSMYTLYDRNFNSIRCSKNNGIIKTDGIQSRGTYYLSLYDYYISSIIKAGKYYQIYWK